MANRKYQSCHVDLYLPSPKIKMELKREARQHGIPLSRYICSVIEARKHPPPDPEAPKKTKELEEVKAENRLLREDLRLRELLLERRETELYKLRYVAFAQAELPSRATLDAELVKMLRRGRTIPPTAILEELHIDPNDSAAVQLVANQLMILRKFDLVKETPNGWRWKDE